MVKWMRAWIGLPNRLIKVGICCGLGYWLAVTVAACQRVESQSAKLAPLPQDRLVQVYMNHEPAASYTEPYRKQTRPGDDLEQVIVAEIAQAQVSVDVAVQEFRLPKIAQALAERRRAGVDVRVILEHNYSRPWSQFTTEELAKLPDRERDRYREFRQLVDTNGDGDLSSDEINRGDALVILDQAQVPRIDDTADGSKGSDLMHHKFVVIDRQIVIVTSANFTTSDVHGDFKFAGSQGNANNLLKLASPELAALFSQEFSFMWGDGPGGQPDSKFGVKKPYRPPQTVAIGNSTVEVQFSPTERSHSWDQSSNGLISHTLSNASQSLEMALFVFSDQVLVNRLESMAIKRVQIRALIEPTFAYRSYSEALDMLGVALLEKCQSETNNHLWQTPLTTVGVPHLPPGDLLHHKFGIVDRQTVITGSHNWTDAANTGNDETLLVVHNPTVAAHFLREFERLYTNAVLGIPPAIQRSVDAQQKQCPAASSGTTRSPSTPPDQTPGTSPSRINLNTASQKELESLPGVGPGLAKRIITARQRKPFTSLADLDQIPGVGASLLNKLSDQVTW